MATTTILPALLLWAVLHRTGAQYSCPPTNATSYVLPGATVDLRGVFLLPSFTTVTNDPFGEGPGGMQLGDVNGDGLSDLLISVSFIVNNAGQTAGYLSCVYINTGCGWIISSDYTGQSPIPDCNAAYNSASTGNMIIRGTAMRVAGLEVHEFVSSILEEFTLPEGSVSVYAGAGHQIRQGRRVLMDRLIASVEGFAVSLHRSENYTWAAN